MSEFIENPIIFNSADIAENFRARVHRLTSGVIVTVPIREGSRGPLYTDTLTTTKHAKLRTSSKHYHLTFDIPLSEGPEYAAQCIDEEVLHFIEYMRNNKD